MAAEHDEAGGQHDDEQRGVSRHTGALEHGRLAERGAGSQHPGGQQQHAVDLDGGAPRSSSPTFRRFLSGLLLRSLLTTAWDGGRQLQQPFQPSWMKDLRSFFPFSRRFFFFFRPLSGEGRASFFFFFLFLSSLLDRFQKGTDPSPSPPPSPLTREEGQVSIYDLSNIPPLRWRWESKSRRRGLVIERKRETRWPISWRAMIQKSWLEDIRKSSERKEGRKRERVRLFEETARGWQSQSSSFLN